MFARSATIIVKLVLGLIQIIAHPALQPIYSSSNLAASHLALINIITIVLLSPRLAFSAAHFARIALLKKLALPAYPTLN